jgi:hypothetical protein
MRLFSNESISVQIFIKKYISLDDKKKINIAPQIFLFGKKKIGLIRIAEKLFNFTSAPFCTT